MLHLKPKRGLGSNALEVLYPYYAGFNLDFARQALELLEVKSGGVVLDPWNGAGTTVCAAAQLGIRAVGIDLNPAVCLAAKARLALLSGGSLPDDDFFETLAIARRSLCEHEPLLAWLTPQSAKYIRSLIASALDRRTTRLDPLELSGLADSQAITLTLAMASVRALVKKAHATNPTWVKTKPVPSVSKDALVDAMSARLQSLRALTTTTLKIKSASFEVAVEDARKMPFDTSSFDGVLTSPPYCTRIDYARTAGIELAFLGFDPNYADIELRRELMGTTALRPLAEANMEIPPGWPSDVRKLLSAVRDHDSYAARRYYFRNILQYFEDASMACAELVRVTRPGARMLLVLQNSFFKDVEIDLPRLYAAFFESLGCDVEVLATQKASKFFASINPRARKHSHERRYEEKVLCVSR